MQTATPDLQHRLAVLRAERAEIAKHAARGSFDAKLDLEQNTQRIDTLLDEMLAQR